MTYSDPIAPVLPSDLRFVGTAFPEKIESGTVWADFTFTGAHLGSGGSATSGVYLANDAILGALVAVKPVRLNDSKDSWFRARGIGCYCFNAKKELTAGSLFGEKAGIMKILKAFTDGSWAVFACEYVPGCKTWTDWVLWAAKQIRKKKMSAKSAQKQIVAVLLQLLENIM
ncbi:hypothetical protein HDU93_000834 [Gonapodya sp. JEL0774]|nr:hypothetical protein HDU93_000834 [Gonapodya sp. JEL0774]